MPEECLICKAPLEYLVADEQMECALCGKKELSKTRCREGHYVCNDCHTQGIDTIFGLCLNEKSCNPVEIMNSLMALPFCHMHGPEHHIMVGAALLTAYKNAGGAIELPTALRDKKPWLTGARRGLRLLGSLRSGAQRGDVRVHRHRLHSPCQ